MNTAKQENVFCANCSKMVIFNICEPVFRCGDAYVCSAGCSKERLRYLIDIDPRLSYSHMWPMNKDEILTKTRKEYLPAKKYPLKQSEK